MRLCLNRNYKYVNLKRTSLFQQQISLYQKKVKSSIIAGVSYTAIAATLTALATPFGIVGGIEMLV